MFHDLHARNGHVWETDKSNGSEIIVAEIDPHGLMRDMAHKQVVADLFASAPRLHSDRQKLLAICDDLMKWDERMGGSESIVWTNLRMVLADVSGASIEPEIVP
jgi:hypothetical protein